MRWWGGEVVGWCEDTRMPRDTASPPPHHPTIPTTPTRSCTMSTHIHDLAGAAFAAVTVGNNVQAVRFTRTARYVRWVATVTGSEPSVNVAVLIGEQRKTI